MEKFLDKADVLLKSDTKKAEFVKEIVKDEKVKVDLIMKQPTLVYELIDEDPVLLAETLLENDVVVDDHIQEALEVMQNCPHIEPNT